MYITDIDEVVSLLRSKLTDYLLLSLGEDNFSLTKKFKCFVHDDNSPSMAVNPKTGGETVKCFACGYHGDIFTVAEHFDNLPTNGAEWLTVTIPTLCEKLDINYSPGTLTALDKERIALYRLAQDISDILASQKSSENEYLIERNWIQGYLPLGTIDPDTLIAKLVKSGWDAAFINSSSFIRTRYMSYFGEDKVTFAIKDHCKRTVGFICRNLNFQETGIPKYVNSPETSIYKKNQSLMGIDVAYRDAKKYGLYIVEGPGDLMQLYRLGIKNAVAVCGTAFTENHLLYLKSLGIRKIFLNFDWDQAGYAATQRVLENILKVTSGISTYVVQPPGPDAKDTDEYLKDKDSPSDYLDLLKVSAFEWQLNSFSDSDTPDIICQKMIPIIAAEETGVKRELLIKELAQRTTVSTASISSDVSAIRNNKFSQKLEKTKAAAENYVRSVEQDPDNIRAHFATHEQAIELIEKEFKTDSIGINYQISRFDAIQELRAASADDESAASFKMNYFKDFVDNMNGGMSWTSGALIYVGGRANSGKTATCLMIGTDIAMSDENAIVIIHSTDDSYEQIEPRIKTNIYRMAYPDGPPLTIGMVVQPNLNLANLPDEYTEAWRKANEAFKELIEKERLVIIDSEDGATLSTLERNLRYYRMRYPNRKIMMICDNTHNYLDFMNLEQSSRMTMISNQQKNLTVKYHACMIATAEYRKNMPMDHSKLKLPVDDDLADARALMYRPNVIWHVYNDMHDRKEHAEIFWKDVDGNVRPRLLLHFTKNKISGFKDKLVVDLDPSTVSLSPVNTSQALDDAENFRDLKSAGYISNNGKQVMYVEADEYEADT
jgi:DNA primase catalytic core